MRERESLLFANIATPNALLELHVLVNLFCAIEFIFRLCASFSRIGNSGASLQSERVRD